MDITRQRGHSQKNMRYYIPSVQLSVFNKNKKVSLEIELSSCRESETLILLGWGGNYDKGLLSNGTLRITWTVILQTIKSL